MFTQATKIEQAMAAGDAQGASRATAALFESVSPKEAVSQFTEASRGYSIDVLGWVLFPAILPHLRKSDELFEQMLALAGEENLPEPFHLVLLDFLQGAAYTRSDRESYWTALRALATSPSYSLRVRARAAQDLGQDSSEATTPVLGSLIDSGNPVLIDAAAHAVRCRGVRKQGSSDELANRLAEYASANSGHAKGSLAILNALADIGTPSCRAALHKLAGLRASDEELARLIGAAGRALDDATLAEIVRRATKPGNPQSATSLRSLFGTRPDRLRGLAESGHHDAYLHAATLVVTTGGEPPLEMLESLSGSKDPTIAELAWRLVELAPSGSLPESLRRRRSEVRIGQRLISVEQFFKDAQSAADQRPSDDGDKTPPGRVSDSSGTITPSIIQNPPDAPEPPNLPPEDQPRPWPNPPAQACPSGLHVGGSLYSTLNISHIPTIENHWHAGIFQRFTVNWDGRSAKLDGVHTTGPFPDGVYTFAATGDLSSPRTSVATTLSLMRDRMISEFRTTEDFQGAHTVAGISAGKREDIANTAYDLVGRDLGYSLWHQLDALWEYEWTGEPFQIAAVRCDGVVEYSYERNGVKVCSGIHPELWNIAAPGVNHVDNHTKPHLWSYDSGDLCPRIQAGNEGHGVDSTFGHVASTPPQVLDFTVLSASADPTPSPAPKVPSIWIRPVSAYNVVYLRITVAREGDWNYYFVQTENAPSHPPCLALPLIMCSVGANRVYPMFTWWLGKTFNGPNFAGQNGRYNFRALAVDAGGNVSAEQSLVVNLTW